MSILREKRRTKIVCTLGPACAGEVLPRLLTAGMNVARLNFSHGNLKEHGAWIRRLRDLSQARGAPVAILQDLAGPKMRIGELPQGQVTLLKGQEFILSAIQPEGNQPGVMVNYPQIIEETPVGVPLLLADGEIELLVEGKTDQALVCRVVVGGVLRSQVGINFPRHSLSVPTFTPKDREDLRFGIENGVDFVALSYVRSPQEVMEARDFIKGLGADTPIIAKIEKHEALDHLEEILQAADGLMVARGDLGVEIPIEQIAGVQKQLVRQANLVGKPVITATQMLESMVANRRPTRAEATDVANAILDGTDCVMLSEESAMGKYPVEAVAMLAKIAAAIEPHRPAPEVRKLLRTSMVGSRMGFTDLITLSVDATLEKVAPAAVFIPTRSGATARSLARFRPPVWIVAVSSREATCQQLALTYGVHPIFEPQHPEDWTAYLRRCLKALEISGDFAVLTEGPSSRHPEANNRMELINLK